MDKVDQVQIIVVGHPTSGKTTFINKVIESPGQSKIPIRQMNFEMRKSNGIWLGQKMDIGLWDTKQLIANSSQGKLAMKGKDLIIIVFDISNTVSYEALGSWIKFANQMSQNKAQKVLLANKTDLDPCVSIGKIQDLAETNSMKLYFTNNKNNNSKSVFDLIIIDYLGFLLREEIKRKVEQLKNDSQKKSGIFSSFFASKKNISEEDFKETISKISSLKVENIAKRFQQTEAQIKREIRKKLEQCYLQCYGKDIEYSNQHKENPPLNITVQIIRQKMIEINKEVNQFNEEVLTKRSSNYQLEQKNKTLIEKLKKTEEEINRKEMQKIMAIKQKNQLDKKCFELQSRVKILQLENKRKKEELDIRRAENTTTKLAEQTIKFISQIQEQKSHIELTLSQERENDIFKEGHILKSMLRQLPGFGCQALRKTIEEHTKRRISDLNKVYEFEGPTTRLPHRRLACRRDLLFLFQLGGEINSWLCAYLPGVFEPGASTRDGLLFRVRDATIDVYGCAEHSEAVFWRYNHVLLGLGKEELYFDHVRGVLRTQNSRVGWLQRRAKLCAGRKPEYFPSKGGEWLQMRDILEATKINFSSDIVLSYRNSLGFKFSQLPKQKNRNSAFEIIQITFSDQY